MGVLRRTHFGKYGLLLVRVDEIGYVESGRWETRDLGLLEGCWKLDGLWATGSRSHDGWVGTHANIVRSGCDAMIMMGELAGMGLKVVVGWMNW